MGEMANDGQLHEVEFFIFADNSVTEGAVFKDSSSNILLFDLVLRLNMIEQQYDMIVHVIHATGTQMIAQGSNGFLRGSVFEGVM